MADDSQRAKARATFGSTFFDNSKAIAPPKNFATAQQKTANSRPIPTFKVGGVVKKADGGLPDVRKDSVNFRAALNSMPNAPVTGAQPAAPMQMPTQPTMKKGGKVQTSSDTARKLAKEMGGFKDGGVSERGKAFRAAYDRGDKEFTFNGKRFTTEMAKPSDPKTAAPKVAPSVSVTRTSVTVPVKDQQYMSDSERTDLGVQRRAGLAKAVAGKSVSDSPLFDARPMKKADATGQTPAQMYKSMMSESKSMPKAKGNDDLYKLFIDNRGREFGDKQKQMKMAARASAGKDLVSAANKLGSFSGIGSMKKGGKAWEGSAKDEAQDRMLAKKNGMSMKQWEASSKDAKHDRQMSTKGLKDGGVEKKAMGGTSKYRPSSTMYTRPSSNRALPMPRQQQMAQGKQTLPMDMPQTSPMPRPDQMPPMPQTYPMGPQTGAPMVGQGMAPAGAMRKGGKAGCYAVGGAGKTRLGMAPIKRAQGGTNTKSTLHPATSNKTGDRRDPEYGDYVLGDKNAMKKLQGSSPAPVKKAQGGAAKVRRGMMTQSGQITPGRKPHKGLGGF